MAYTGATRVICVCAAAAAPETLAREHVGVPPALVGPVVFVAEHFFAHAAFEPINYRVDDADVLSDTADVARACE